MKNDVERLLEGAYDVHLHAAPCIQQRRHTLYELAGLARDAGMAGFVIKDHYVPTAMAAQIVQEVVPAVQVRGGVTLARSSGGLDPAAAEISFRMGGRVVWMLSLEAEWMFRRMRDPSFPHAKNYQNLGVDGAQHGYTIVRDGALVESVKEIVSLCCQHDGVLETSHLSPDEARALFAEAQKQGAHKFVLTHANQAITPYTLSEQKAYAEKGAYIMYCMAQYMGKPNEPAEDIAGLARLIQAVGAAHIVLGTDFGLPIWPSAIEGMRMMVTALLQLGISEQDIRLMVKENPEKLYFETR